MAYITYTALREIVPTGFTKTGTGISAATSDDSFNDASSMSSMLDNEWIEVSGFANAANNGWFQVNGNSTSTKIIQDTANLVTEAAGPTVTIKGYKRGLGQSYNIEFGVEGADRSVDVVSSGQQPLGGGAPEVIFHRREVIISVRSGVIQEVDIPQWREIFTSVEGGETFIFDRYGTVATPVEPKTVMLPQASYKETREGPFFRYHIAFEVMVLN